MGELGFELTDLDFRVYTCDPDVLQPLANYSLPAHLPGPALAHWPKGGCFNISPLDFFGGGLPDRRTGPEPGSEPHSAVFT